MPATSRALLRAVTYGALSVALVIAYGALRGSAWRSSGELHTVMESVATILALVIGAMALVRFYSHKNNTFLFIGTAFLGTALLDGYHAIVTSAYFAPFLPSGIAALIPWSWVASRLFLSVMLWLSWLAWRMEQRKGEAGRVREPVVYLASAVLCVASFILFAFVPLPRAYYPEFVFHRPEEFIPALFFLLALIGYLRKGEWRTESFDHWLVLSLMIGFLSQAAFMSFSGGLFDVEFDAAHTLKKVSYVCVLVGLLISMFETFRQVEEQTDVLQNEVTRRTQVLARRTAELEALNSQLAEAKQSAETANRAKSDFLANMSHELRTPMNAILGYSEMLIEEAEELEQGDFIPDLKKIYESGEHLLSLINDVLDLSKVEAGRMELYLETFEIASVVQTVSSTVRPLVEKNANELVVECDDNLGEMHADVTKLRQSLLNLLSNAAKFTERGTLTLAVTRDRESDRVRFDVSDTGIGIPADRIERVFEEFTQGDESITRNFGGTGLGLAISRRFCRMMGGDISVASEPGAGSTFSIVLPAQVVDETARATEPESFPEGEGALVLVIDDDPAARDLIGRTLTRDGFRVVTADNGEDGLRLARELRPMAITLDIIMPGTDGWSILTALKADPELSEIPVVIVSMLDDQRLGYALGAAEFMTKPVDRARLSEMLRRYQKGDTAGKVLIVEDEADARDMLSRLVEKEGWEVALAGNGREGLALVAEAQPTLIFTDLMMPVMDGFTFVEELRRVEDWKKIPVIVLTAKDLTDEDRRRLSGQVERVLDKGSQSRQDLVDRLRELAGDPQSK